MKKTAFLAISAFLFFFVNVSGVQSQQRDAAPPTSPSDPSWSAFTDNVDVDIYKFFRDGRQIFAATPDELWSSPIHHSQVYNLSQ